jgi:hypothetical protein
MKEALVYLKTKKIIFLDFVTWCASVANNTCPFARSAVMGVQMRTRVQGGLCSCAADLVI